MLAVTPMMWVDIRRVLGPQRNMCVVAPEVGRISDADGLGDGRREPHAIPATASVNQDLGRRTFLRPTPNQRGKNIGPFRSGVWSMIRRFMAPNFPR